MSRGSSRSVMLHLFGSLLLTLKDDESLRRWKEQLLGDVDLENVGGNILTFFFLPKFAFEFPYYFSLSFALC